jgi:aspartate racemase
MRMLGLVGGTSWLSSVEYYSMLNRLANEELGGVDAAKLVLWSVNFGDVARNNARNEQSANLAMILEGCRKVEMAGAEAVVICANTMHCFAAEIQPRIGIPIINLVNEVASEIQDCGLDRVLLLGTKYTMELGFFQAELEKKGIQVDLPGPDDREYIHRTIYEELTRGEFRAETRLEYLRICARSRAQGVKGVILGCTEIPILLGGQDLAMEVFDTLKIHVRTAADFMLGRPIRT